MMNVIIEERLINGNIRYVVTDGNNIVIDDAQGFGFKSREKAWKCYWYKFYQKKNAAI